MKWLFFLAVGVLGGYVAKWISKEEQGERRASKGIARHIPKSFLFYAALAYIVGFTLYLVLQS